MDDHSFPSQGSKFNLTHEEDEHQIKEEVEEVQINDLGLKQEPGDPSMTSVKEESPKTEAQSADRHPEESSQESGVNVPVIVSVLSLANCEQQHLFGSSDVSQSQNRGDDNQEDSTIHKRKRENAKRKKKP